MNEDERNLEQRIKDHFDVAVEKMQDNFDLLADGQKDLKENFQLMADDMDGVKSDIVDMKIKLKSVEKGVRGINEKLD